METTQKSTSSSTSRVRLRQSPLLSSKMHFLGHFHTKVYQPSVVLFCKWLRWMYQWFQESRAEKLSQYAWLTLELTRYMLLLKFITRTCSIDHCFSHDKTKTLLKLPPLLIVNYLIIQHTSVINYKIYFFIDWNATKSYTFTLATLYI